MEIMNKVRIIIGGSGGQGVLTLGKLLSFASIRKNYNICCLPTYSAEMRGGYIYNFVTISKNNEIFSPLSKSCDIGVFLNETSFKMLKEFVKKDAFFILNTSLIKNVSKKTKKIQIPATEIAEKIGDIRVTNMVMAGAVSKLINDKFFDFEKENLICEVEKIIGDIKILNLCINALEKGWDFVANLKI